MAIFLIFYHDSTVRRFNWHFLKHIHGWAVHAQKLVFRGHFLSFFDGRVLFSPKENQIFWRNTAIFSHKKKKHWDLKIRTYEHVN